ncbi:uncharacterized protein LOC144059528 [Vanacampus margaritifer]
MRATAGLVVLVWLVTVSQGMDTPCDVRKTGAQCYGRLAGEIVLHLMDKGPFVFNWEKGRKVLLKAREGNGPISEKYSFTPSNGMVKIKKLMRNDSGIYNLIVFNKKGIQLENQTLRLFIEAPVTSVHLTSDCVSQGLQPVSCSSKGGDSPQYSWSLNQKPLQDSHLLSGNVQANNITLKPGVSGQLVCSVRNNVSEVTAEVHLSCVFVNCTSNGTLISQWLPEIKKNMCDNPTYGNKSHSSPNYLPLMWGILSALLILLLIGLGVVYKQKKKQSGIEDQEDLTYADVRIVNQSTRSIKVRGEVEVEYGQVKFSERPRRTVKAESNACVYAQVYRGR